MNRKKKNELNRKKKNELRNIKCEKYLNKFPPGVNKLLESRAVDNFVKSQPTFVI